MEKGQITLKLYVKSNGVKPFEAWLLALKNPMYRARVQVRLDRVATGHFGDFKTLGDGLYELRLDIGPGFRIYYAKWKDSFVILFSGGDKSTQKRDITKAREYWIDYKERTHDNKK